jgi:hypothetical protein
VTGQGHAVVPARVPLRRLRGRSRTRRTGRGLLMNSAAWAIPGAVLVVLAVGAVRAVSHLLVETGWAIPGAPGRLFVVAAVLLLLGALAQVLRSAGPVTAGAALWFWLLSAPVRRRDLLRRRYGALLAAIAVTACVLAAVVAHAASVPALPVVAAACAAVALAGAAVCAQAWEIADRAVHAVGLALRTAGVLAFGSLATGAGRQHLNSALHAPPLAALILLVALALTAVAGCLLGYRGLDRIDVGLLRGGQGLWTAGGVAAMSMDVFMLSDFLADQRARQAGRVRPTRLGAGFAAALARSEWARVRRRPSLALRAAVAAIVWWGCRPVVDRPALAALALVTGYCLVLPVGGTLRQLTANPGLRAQFAGRDRWLTVASLAACLVAAVMWTAMVAPGLGGGAALAAVIAAGLAAAVYRTVTRPPLEHFGPLVPTPFGDLPLDLFRQLARGLVLLAVLSAVTALVTAR